MRKYNLAPVKYLTYNGAGTDLHRKKQKYKQKELILEKDLCQQVDTKEHENNPPIEKVETTRFRGDRGGPACRQAGLKDYCRN
jgi:hypothetical protein